MPEHQNFWNHATFWLLVSMVIFLAFAGKPMVRGILGMLDTRRAAIRKTLEEAEHLRAEAQSLLEKRQQQQADALNEAREIIEEAKADAARLRAEAKLKLTEALAAREQQALAKIAEAEANAAREARDMAATLALAASRTLLAERLTAAAADTLIDKAIAEIPAKLAS